MSKMLPLNGTLWLKCSWLLNPLDYLVYVSVEDLLGYEQFLFRKERKPCTSPQELDFLVCNREAEGERDASSELQTAELIMKCCVDLKSPQENIWAWISSPLLLIPPLGTQQGISFPDASFR